MRVDEIVARAGGPVGGSVRRVLDGLGRELDTYDAFAPAVAEQRGRLEGLLR